MKNKVVIFKKPDLGIIKLHFNENKFGDGKRDIKEDSLFQKYTKMGYDYFVSDIRDIPSKKGIESRRQLYHDGNTVKIDTKWEHRLMPDQLIKSKHIAKLNSKLDELLSKKSADQIEILKMVRSIENSKTVGAGPFNESVHWLEIAQSNLDENINNGHTDKPNIRKLLSSKIAELKAK